MLPLPFLQRHRIPGVSSGRTVPTPPRGQRQFVSTPPHAERISSRGLKARALTVTSHEGRVWGGRHRSVRSFPTCTAAKGGSLRSPDLPHVSPEPLLVARRRHTGPHWPLRICFDFGLCGTPSICCALPKQRPWPSPWNPVILVALPP